MFICVLIFIIFNVMISECESKLEIAQSKIENLEALLKREIEEIRKEKRIRRLFYVMEVSYYNNLFFLRVIFF
jgi:energy-converting hydrogenase Eha subunit H